MRLVGKITVQGMSQFVSDGRHAPVTGLITHEYVGMQTVNTPGISAGTLALVFVPVNPAVSESMLQDLAVGFT